MLSSAIIPLIRAAAEGNTDAVRALLANGADVNESTTRGETALIRAAFFGHADVVRLLLEAGADARRKDSLGITALEWAIRRDAREVTRILQATPSTTGTEAQWLNKAVEARKRSDANVSDAVLELGRAEPPPTSAEGDDSILALGFDEPPPPAPKAWAASAPAGLPATHDEVEIESEEAASTSHFDAAGVFVEEVRAQADAEAHEKSAKEARRDVGVGESDEPAGPALVLESTTKESPQGSGIKRCPRCHTTYESDILYYCMYHPVKLIDVEDRAFGVASPVLETVNTTGMRPWMLVLVAITFIGGSLIGHLISSAVFPPRTPRPAQTALALGQTPLADVQQIQPVVGGAAKGKEISLPGPEYPERAKSQRISGEVTVAVLVNKRGGVISARALNGHPLLQAAALKAAREAKFSTEKLTGRRANVSGTITYNFQL